MDLSGRAGGAAEQWALWNAALAVGVERVRAGLGQLDGLVGVD